MEIQRALIHKMADKYGLLTHPGHNGIKVAKFTLLTLYHPGRGAPNQQSDTFINALDSKDRVREYHNQVHEKRKLIHQKKMERRRREELENPQPPQLDGLQKLESKDAKLGGPGANNQPSPKKDSKK